MPNGIFMQVGQRSTSNQSQNFSQKARLESLKYLKEYYVILNNMLELELQVQWLKKAMVLMR